MTSKKYTVKIYETFKPRMHTDECDSVVSCDSVNNAIAYLWALANQSMPEYAMANIGDHHQWIDNATMRGKPAPCEQAKIDMERLNETAIESLVVEALNDKYDKLKGMINVSCYVEMIEKHARQWAMDCYQ